ncbi:MAG: hypothetical protein QF793_03540 [Candidatus Peribacteraceae bacterium]|jgi:hypothetical protein|nr:hypothetical protein [Candidatus Peribacteraceae bacterium]|tara:strand:+ start:33385 stop:34077 length:693 start_codon:yes stop_codon:yes gene_type:complete
MQPQEHIVDTAITETQESTGTVTATEFQSQVEQRVAVTTTAMQDQFGDAADELIGNVTVTMSSWKQSMDDLVGPDSVGDTEEEGAAAYVEIASKKKVTSKRATDLHVEDRPYWERVRIHEEVHQNDQATDYNAQTVTYLDESDQMQEVTVVGDLTEWQPITVANQPDSDLTPDYIVHRENGNTIAEIAGEGAVTSTLASGDVESLQQTIIEKQHDQMVELVLSGEQNLTY